MKVDFRTLANPSVSTLTPYQPGKPIEELERELGITSSIKLASNENPLGPSPKAVMAAEHALKRAHIYPDGSYFELKQSLAQFLSVSPNQIIIGNGSDNIFELIAKAYLQKGDSAVISQYAFLTIPIILQSYGVTIKTADALEWGHDVTAMVRAIDEKTRVLFLVNPNNPTGTYTNENDFRTLLNAVPPNVLIVADEAYVEYIAQPDFPDSLSYLLDFPNLIITRTFSKAYGLAGLRVGYAISSPEVIDILNRARLPFNVNHIGIEAARAALADQSHVGRTAKLNFEGMDQLEKELNALNIAYIPSIANFITINVGNGSEIYQKLLAEGVIVRPLNAYQMPEHIRVSIGTHEENNRFLQTIRKLI